MRCIALRKMRAAVLVLALVGCAGGDEPVATHASRRDCARLRKRLIEVRLDGITIDRDRHRAAIAASLDESFLQSCVRQMPRRQVLCAARARDAAAIAACAKA